MTPVMSPAPACAESDELPTAARIAATSLTRTGCTPRLYIGYKHHSTRLESIRNVHPKAMRYKTSDGQARRDLRAPVARRRALLAVPALVSVRHRDDVLGFPSGDRAGSPRAIAGARRGGDPRLTAGRVRKGGRTAGGRDRAEQ